jgi:hypothetical protein
MTDPLIPPGRLPNGKECRHEGQLSTYCTKCWANLFEARQPLRQDGGPAAVPVFMSKKAYAQLPKAAELRPSFFKSHVVGGIISVIIIFSIKILSGRHSVPDSVLDSLIGGSAVFLGILTARWAQGEASLALSEGHLVGPPGRGGRRNTLPIQGLSLEPLERRSIADRIWGVVTLEHPSGLSTRFSPGLYRRAKLKAFFDAVRDAQSASA